MKQTVDEVRAEAAAELMKLSKEEVVEELLGALNALAEIYVVFVKHGLVDREE